MDVTAQLAVNCSRYDSLPADVRTQARMLPLTVWVSCRGGSWLCTRRTAGSRKFPTEMRRRATQIVGFRGDVAREQRFANGVPLAGP